MSVTEEENKTGQATDFSQQETWILGYFYREVLSEHPHNEWFEKEYHEYFPERDTFDHLKKININGLTVKVVLGSWCPDSRREVPRFMKILDLWEFPMEKVTFIGVDNVKISPVEEYEALIIERVPTFIFYENNIEAGRIIENPESSLERDMLEILTGNE